MLRSLSRHWRKWPPLPVGPVRRHRTSFDPADRAHQRAVVGISARQQALDHLPGDVVEGRDLEVHDGVREDSVVACGIADRRIAGATADREARIALDKSVLEEDLAALPIEAGACPGHDRRSVRHQIEDDALRDIGHKGRVIWLLRRRRRRQQRIYVFRAVACRATSRAPRTTASAMSSRTLWPFLVRSSIASLTRPLAC